jgi:tagatose 1,6-diphosphate aldolase GatY/KbaY
VLASTTDLLRAARAGGYAVGAFNIYNLEGVQAVVGAAEAAQSPVMLQLLPTALTHGGTPLVALCLSAARTATVPIAVHLDHSTSAADIDTVLAAGANSIMADGSHLSYAENLAFTAAAATLAHTHGAAIEAELGRLSGSEDGLTVADYEAKLTDPGQATEFVSGTDIDALAVCIGNVHGHYHGEPRLDFARLEAIRQAVSVPLVLHGASGLPEAMVRQAIACGVCKFNVNTEVREAYLQALRTHLAGPKAEMLDLMAAAVAAMQAVVAEKLRLFGAIGQIS